MIKIFLIIAIILGCAYLGRLFSKSLEIRTDIIKSFSQDIVLFKNLIFSEGRDLLFALNKMSVKGDYFLSNLYFKTYKSIEDNPSADVEKCWSNIISENDKENGRTYIKEDDLDKINAFGSVLSLLRHSASINIIDSYLKELNDYIEIQQTEQVKKTKIYSKMGLLGGLFIGIILI
jgi:stage III sporulation protein AB